MAESVSGWLLSIATAPLLRAGRPACVLSQSPLRRSPKLFEYGELFRAFNGVERPGIRATKTGFKKESDLGQPFGEAGATVSDKDHRDRQSARHVSEGRYANFFQIGHNASEFLIEFGQQDAGECVFHTRIYVCADQARILADLMTSTLEQHERIFGKTLRVVPSEFESD
jgi:Protein of unknown function (DUF3467)